MLFVIYKPFFNAITCNFDLCMSWLSRWSMIFHKSYPYIMFFLLRLSIKMLFCSNNISAAEYLFDSKYIVCCFFYIMSCRIQRIFNNPKYTDIERRILTV